MKSKTKCSSGVVESGENWGMTQAAKYPRNNFSIKTKLCQSRKGTKLAILCAPPLGYPLEEKNYVEIKNTKFVNFSAQFLM
jgi:hypothetical protein